jgi:hypothetical protein
LGGKCFWLLKNGGDGSCVVKDRLKCSDLLVEDQCSGDNVPSSLKNKCFWLKENDSESSSRKQNNCIRKVRKKKKGEREKEVM